MCIRGRWYRYLYKQRSSCWKERRAVRNEKCHCGGVFWYISFPIKVLWTLRRRSSGIIAVFLEGNSTTAKDECAGESNDTLAPSQNLVAEQILRAVLGYNLKWRNERYLEGAIMSITWLDSWMLTVVLCVVQNKKRGGYRHKENPDT